MEREALVSADLKGVQEATYAKEALIEAIRHQELERLRITTELALSWKKPLRELTLPTIIIAVQGKDQQGAEQLRSAFNALTILIGRIQEQNDSNKGLVQRSLEHIQNMKRNVLGEGVSHSQTYTQQGQRATNAGGARLISKEA